MDVELYVYDLSQGLARQVSLQLTGVQIDAIYHTAIVFNNVEYFFGQGIHRKLPASTHHGRPIEIIKLGRTEIPIDTIEQYIDSLASIYTQESYDLFLHNCNHFSQDLAVFLVGKGIPQKIRDLPETFLRTPMGQMLRTQLDQSMRRMTQAPDAAAGVSIPSRTSQSRVMKNGVAPGKGELRTPNGKIHPTLTVSASGFINGKPLSFEPGHVRTAVSVQQLEDLLQEAQDSCAVLFFTSSTCAPCKIVYPAFDELAAEAGRGAVLVKIDINLAHEIAQMYSIRATPTFMTLLKGQKHGEWTGANEHKLRQEVGLLVQMATPQRHVHASLRLPTLQKLIASPVMFTNVPPLEKIMAKIGLSIDDPAYRELIDYIKIRESKGLREAVVPTLTVFNDFIMPLLEKTPLENRFAVVDLVRISTIDPRITSLLLTKPAILLQLMPVERQWSDLAHSLQQVTLQLACNLFASNLVQTELLEHDSKVKAAMEYLAAECLLAPRSNIRNMAAALVYNLAAFDHNERMQDRPDQLKLDSEELEAALVQAVVNENESKQTLHSLLNALGVMLYGAKQDSSIAALCSAMELREDLKGKEKNPLFKGEPLLREVGDELLGKGFTV